MKFYHLTIAPVLLGGFIILPSYALQFEDDSPPANPNEHSAAAAEKLAPQPAAKNQPLAFLGIVTSPMPEVLAVHLQLEQSQGVIVRSVMPEGPAQLSGVETFDVITKVGDCVVNRPECLSKAISTHRPGDQITLKIIHRGTEKSLNIVLGERPKELSQVAPQNASPLDLDGFPQDVIDRVRREMSTQADQTGNQLSETMRQLQKQLQQAAPAPDAASDPSLNFSSNMIMRVKDSQGCVEWQTNANGKSVTVRDAQGAAVWSGPWNNEADHAAAPDAIRNRINEMEVDQIDQSNTPSPLQFGPAPTP